MPLGGSPWMPPKPHDAFGRAPVSEQRSRTAVGRFVATDSYRLPLLHLPRIDLTASTSETTGTRLRMEAPLDVPSRNSASHLGLPPSLTCVVLERARDSKVRTTDQCSSRSKDRDQCQYQFYCFVKLFKDCTVYARRCLTHPGLPQKSKDHKCTKKVRKKSF